MAFPGQYRGRHHWPRHLQLFTNPAFVPACPEHNFQSYRQTGVATTIGTAGNLPIHETWNATQNTPGASFYYDSPVFLSAFLSLSGTAINPIQLLAPGAVPSNNQFFGVGGNVAQAIRTSTRCRQNLPDPSQSPQSRTLPSRLLSVAGRVCAPPASITIIRAAKGVARRVDGAESRRRFLG